MASKGTPFPARHSDLINQFAAEAYVPEIHLIIDFDGKIDAPRMKKAIRLLLDAEPVLGCRFVETWRKAHWQPLAQDELERADILRVVSASDAAKESAMQDFLGDLMDASVGPQLKGLLLASPQNDRLVLKINHMTCDAGGFKETLYRLSAIYHHLSVDADYRPEVRSGSRSLGQVYRRFSLVQKMGILKCAATELIRASTPLKSRQYASGKDKIGPLAYRFLHFPLDETTRLVAATRRHDCTLNDLFVTAALRAMARQCRWGRDDTNLPMRLIGTVDLRRYLPSGKADSLCMLSGIYFVTQKTIGDEPFDATLRRIKAQIDDQKRNYFGLGIMLIAYLMTAPYPHVLKKILLRQHWRHHLATGKLPPGLTNLGRIDHHRSTFDKTAIINIIMTVPAICPPWFGCGLSGYGGTLTLSSGVYPSAIPVERVESFFRIVAEELSTVTGDTCAAS